MKDVMLDFETLGNGKNKCLVQVGACYFDRVTGEIGDTYSANINPATHVKAGAMIDAETVMWWMAQSDEARASIMSNGRDVTAVMNELNDFLEPAARIWSHATFDFVTLGETLKQLDIKPKFKYRSGLDIRTLVYLAGINVKDTVREGTHHNGLDDCKHQVKYCVLALNAVKMNKQVLNLLNKMLAD